MLRRNFLGLLVLCLVATGASTLRADEHYSGGVTVDIDRDVLGYLWIDDATVNLYKNAHVKNDYYLGDVYITSGAVVNIYGGQIDNVMMISKLDNDLPDALVTVHGTEFAVDGVPVAPGTEELFLQSQVLSGLYEDGTPFAYTVECHWEGDWYLTVHLNWLDGSTEPEEPEEPAVSDIELMPEAVEFGEVTVGQHALQVAAVVNAGDAPLTVESVTLEDESMQFFVSAVSLPAVLEPNDILEIGLVYVPAVEEAAAGVLTVISDDPDEQTVQFALSGMGAAEVVPLTPLEQMDMILAFFDEAVEAGTLEGCGWGWSARYKLNAMEHLLKTARYLIEREYYGYAAEVLRAADMKSDGLQCPYDFVEGDATAELNAQVVELYEILKSL